MGIQNLAGQSIGQYELQELLGLGGMGAVYRAFQPSLKRSVAIKILTPALAQQPGIPRTLQPRGRDCRRAEHNHIVDLRSRHRERHQLRRDALPDRRHAGHRMRRQRDEGLPMPSPR